MAKVANNKNDLARVRQQGRNCRIARATLNHRTGANLFGEKSVATSLR